MKSAIQTEFYAGAVPCFYCKPGVGTKSLNAGTTPCYFVQVANETWSGDSGECNLDEVSY